MNNIVAVFSRIQILFTVKIKERKRKNKDGRRRIKEMKKKMLL